MYREPLTCYYAHPRASYGTDTESRDMRTLEALCLRVFNPNSEDLERQAETMGMEAYRPHVEACDVFAFRALPDGSITSGVALELSWARDAGKIIIELPAFALRRTLTPEQTEDYIRETRTLVR